MSLVKHLQLPREHGAWGRLTVAVGAGLFTAGQPGEGSAWLVLAALLAFSSRESLVQTFAGLAQRPCCRQEWPPGPGEAGPAGSDRRCPLSSPRAVGLAGARSGRRCSGRAAPQACTGGT